MVQPPKRPPKEKIIRDKNGGLYILCQDSNYVGMNPGSLSDIVRCSLVKANFIIDILEKLCSELQVITIDTITEAVFNISNLISDPPIENENNKLKDIDITTSQSLISIEDISNILNIHKTTATELYDNFNQPIYNNTILDEFLIHIDQYIDSKYDGVLPAITNEFTSKPQNTNNKFNSTILAEILTQQPPIELSQSVKKDQIQAINDTIIENTAIEHNFIENKEVHNNKTADILENKTNPEGEIYTHENFVESPFFTSTHNLIQEFLEVDEIEAKLILTSPQALNDFLELHDIEKAKHILNQAANGDIETLVATMDTRIERLLNDMDKSTKVSLPSNIDLSGLTKKEAPSVPPDLSQDIEENTRNSSATPQTTAKSTASQSSPAPQATAQSTASQSSAAPQTTAKGTASQSSSAPQATAKSTASQSSSTPQTTAKSTASQSSPAPQATAKGTASQSSSTPQTTAKSTASQSSPAPQATAKSTASQSSAAPKTIAQSTASQSSLIPQETAQSTASQSSLIPQETAQSTASQSSPIPQATGTKNNKDSDVSLTGKAPNLAETLNFIFEKNKRITSKSLMTSFAMFEVTISKELARYIIENKYGDAAPNSHRIMDKVMLQKLIDDIQESEDLNEFIKVYLSKVNDELQSILTGSS